MENNKKIWGLEPEIYNKLASRHSKVNMFLWVVGGLIYNFLYGNLFTLSSVLVIIPGIFIISFASILTLWVNIKKMQILPKTNNLFILIGFTFWFVFDLVYPIALSIGFIYIVNLIF